MRAFIYIVLAGVVAASACDIETTPNPQQDAGTRDAFMSDVSDDADAPARVEQGFAQERYGIGAGWYEYDATTHAVTPMARVYRFDRGEESYAFEVDSYYSDEGESGFFHLRISRMQDGAWAAPERLVLESSVKEAPVCVDLAATSVVDCSDDARDLVLRTDLRVVPAAGFAVQNPAIYAATHFGREAPARLYYQPSESLEQASDGWTALPNSASAPDTALLTSYLDEERSPLFLQATGAFEVALWRMEVADDTVTLWSTCSELESTSDAQPPLSTDSLVRHEVDWPEDGGHLLTLCGDDGPAVASSYDEPLRGSWPSTDTFELFVERYDGRIAVRVAPGQLIWTSGESNFEGLLSVPVHLWEQ